jgi:hypothetical protein
LRCSPTSAADGLVPAAPPTNRKGIDADDPDLRRLQRVYFANRGVWDMGWWCGPAISMQTTEADVDLYLAVFRLFLAELTRGLQQGVRRTERRSRG